MAQTALLDADIIVYRAAAGAESDIDWGDGHDGPTVDPQAAIDNAMELVRDWTKKAGCRLPVLFFSSRDKINFRKTVLPTYKSGRPDKPQVYWDTCLYLESKFKSYRIEGLEADDLLGIASTSDRFKDAVVVSTDKDMKTLPALVFNPNKDARPRRIRPQLADYFWMMQTLMGDTTDGYKGCPGVGPVTAEKILNEAGLFLPAMWRAVVSVFLDRGHTEEDAITQARMARILRDTDYNREKKEIALWHPKEPRWLSLESLPLASEVSLSPSTPQQPKAESQPSPESSSDTTGSRKSASRGRSKK